MTAPLVAGLSLALSLVAGAILALEAEEPTIPIQKSKKRQNNDGGLVREPHCRRILEKIFNKPFPKVRPNFLRNPIPDKYGRHHNLELDGYCEQLKIAFEHNGKHHYEWNGPNSFVPTIEDFQYLVQKDNYKIDRCRELDITLLVILDENKVKFDEIEQEIVRQLIKHGRLAKDYDINSITTKKKGHKSVTDKIRK